MINNACGFVQWKIPIVIFMFFLAVLISLPAFAPAQNTPGSASGQDSSFLAHQVDSLKTVIEKAERETLWIALSIIFLIAIFLFVVLYLVYLRREFSKVCREGKELTEFIKAPAGVPQGTIRSILTLIIVTFSLFLIILVAFGVTKEFPEVLTAILSAVIGFYFGNRAAFKAVEPTDAELERTVQQKDQAIEEKNKGKAAEIFKKVEKGVALAKTVTALLPEDLKKKHQGTLEKLERGTEAAKDLLTKGDLGSAVKAADEVFGLFKKENPLRDIVSKALSSIGKISGMTASPMSIISTVVGIGTTLTGGAYARWKASILNSPFSPSVVPLKAVDADTGFSLILQSPILKEAFKEKLKANDRPFMEAVAKDFITMEAPDLWKKKEYADLFESQEAFETGLQEFRKSVGKRELRLDLDPDLLKEIGDSQTLMDTIDKIEKDEEANADLGLLVEVVEGLQKAGEPVKSIFDKIKKEIGL